jgi:hypothetical protein
VRRPRQARRRSNQGGSGSTSRLGGFGDRLFVHSRTFATWPSDTLGSCRRATKFEPKSRPDSGVIQRTVAHASTPRYAQPV